MGVSSSRASDRTKRKEQKTTGPTCSDIHPSHDPHHSRKSSRKNIKGKVFLVGAGPGDPSLITRRAIDCISKADLIVYDHLVNPRLLRYARDKAQKVYAGKLAGKHTLPQNEINRLLTQAAATGKLVCRLKGGDPLVFGRGGEEAQHLAKTGIPFEIVPGVSSAIAAAAYAGIPLTHRKMASTAAFITGSEAPHKPGSTIAWDKISTGADTLVFLMAVKNLPHIAARLIREGKNPDTPAALVQWGTLPRQRCLEAPLGQIAASAAKQKVQPPAILVVGDVVRLRNQLSWFEKKPLFGRTILVTRATSQAEPMIEMIEELGGQAVEFPTIEIQPLHDYSQLDAAISTLPAYHWIVFTSANGVAAFLSRMQQLKKDARHFAGVSICSIGPYTGEALRHRNLVPDLQPKHFSSQGIIEEFRRIGKMQGRKILLARSNLADDTLPSALSRLGADVKEVVCYRTSAARPDRSIIRTLLDGKIDAVTFTSASTVRNFARILGSDLKKIPDSTVFASIGPVTTAAARQAGLSVHLQALEYTVPGLIGALLTHFHRSSASG